MTPISEGPTANLTFKQITTSSMAEHPHTLHPVYSQQRQDLTPYSAVSSFNLPAHYDSSLMTPVSLTNSPSISTNTGPIIRSDRDIQFSPSPMSPNQLLADDDDVEIRYNPPMKHKDPSSTLQIQTDESPFPSPYHYPERYFGSYSVSTTSASGRTMDGSPSIQPSPQLHSAGGQSTGSYHSYQQTPPQSATSSASFRSNQTPILIAPNPLSLRPATTQERASNRHNSAQSIRSSHSLSSSSAYSEGVASRSPPRGKKRKSPAISTPDDDSTFSSDLNFEDNLLLELISAGDLQWKDVCIKFNEKTRKNMKVPALQMRKKRLLERMRDNSVALTFGEGDKTSWESASDRTGEHGSGSERWPKEASRRKPESGLEKSPSGTPEHRMTSYTQRTSRDTTAWSDERGSANNGAHDTESRLMSALSTSPVDEVRNRPSGDSHHHLQHNHQYRHGETALRYQLPSQPHIERMVYDQAHHQRHPW